MPYDLLLKETDPALVSMEMDIGWVIAGGADPVAYLTKYPSRYSSVHIKDLKNEGIPNTNMKMTSAIIGQGIVDWDKVLACGEEKQRAERLSGDRGTLCAFAHRHGPGECGVSEGEALIHSRPSPCVESQHGRVAQQPHPEPVQ